MLASTYFLVFVHHLTRLVHLQVLSPTKIVYDVTSNRIINIISSYVETNFKLFQLIRVVHKVFENRLKHLHKRIIYLAFIDS